MLFRSPFREVPTTFRYLVWSLKDLVLLLLVEAAAVAAVLAALTITEAGLVTIAAETRFLITRKSGVHSSVGVGDDVVGEVQELSQVLETRVRQGVVEMAPAVGLADVATRPEGLEQLDHLEVAHGDVLSVLVLSQNVGGVDVINSGEDSILKELTVDQQNVLSINEQIGRASCRERV